jgi:hypothetical protein
MQYGTPSHGGTNITTSVKEMPLPPFILSYARVYPKVSGLTAWSQNWK